MKTVYDHKRCLYLGEMFYTLNTNYNNVIGCGFYDVKSNTLYIPRNILNGGILPLFINDTCNKHYNLIIVNQTKRVIERFEPIDITEYGYLNKLLKQFCKDYHYDYVYNIRGPQYTEMNYLKISTMNCGFWILSYLDNRLCCLNVCQSDFLRGWMKQISIIGVDKYINKYKSQILNGECDEYNLRIHEKSVLNSIYNRLPLDYYIYRH
jgi:hypothetical protein